MMLRKDSHLFRGPMTGRSPEDLQDDLTVDIILIRFEIFSTDRSDLIIEVNGHLIPVTVNHLIDHLSNLSVL